MLVVVVAVPSWIQATVPALALLIHSVQCEVQQEDLEDQTSWLWLSCGERSVQLQVFPLQ